MMYSQRHRLINKVSVWNLFIKIYLPYNKNNVNNNTKKNH